MIIEAGYDIVELLAGTVRSTAEGKRSLWVLCMDAELHHLGVYRARDIMTGPLESHADDILAVFESCYRPVAYFALAHSATETSPYSVDPHCDPDEPMRQLPALADHQFLGRLIFDDEGYYSTLPRYSFRDYPSLCDLPRTVTVPGPHEFD